MLPHIFELFTQIDAGADRAQGGLGIGLTLVRSGWSSCTAGTSTATSPGAGRGSEFVVRLPVAPPRRRPGRPVSPGGQTSPGRHVLIVEDNRDGRESLALLLGTLGHRVDVAEDGPRGVEVALAVRPEVALIDIGLPKLDGYEVAAGRAGLGGGVPGRPDRLRPARRPPAAPTTRASTPT